MGDGEVVDALLDFLGGLPNLVRRCPVFAVHSCPLRCCNAPRAFSAAFVAASAFFAAVSASCFASSAAFFAVVADFAAVLAFANAAAAALSASEEAVLALPDASRARCASAAAAAASPFASSAALAAVSASSLADSGGIGRGDRLVCRGYGLCGRFLRLLGQPLRHRRVDRLLPVPVRRSRAIVICHLFLRCFFLCAWMDRAVSLPSTSRPSSSSAWTKSTAFVPGMVENVFL